VTLFLHMCDLSHAAWINSRWFSKFQKHWVASEMDCFINICFTLRHSLSMWWVGNCQKSWRNLFWPLC